MTIQDKTLRKALWGLGGVAAAYWALQNLTLLFSLFGRLASITMPFVIGFCLAFVLNVPMRALEQNLPAFGTSPHTAKLRRPVCLVLALLFIILVISLVMNLVVPELANTVSLLATIIPDFVSSVQAWALENADTTSALGQWIANLAIDWAELGRNALNLITSSAGNLLDGTMSIVSAVVSGTVNGVIGLIVAIYILIDKENLRRQMARFCTAFLPKKACSPLFGIAHLASRTFANFVAGQCIEACILGLLCWLGMTLLRLPYAPMIGSLVGLTALIPIVGAFIGTAVGAFMILMVNPLQAVTFVIFLLILQQIEGNIIYPRVVGSSVGLPPLWCLAAITVGGSVAGIVGMLFAVPTASVIYTLVRNAVQHRLDGTPYLFE